MILSGHISAVQLLFRPGPPRFQAFASSETCRPRSSPLASRKSPHEFTRLASMRVGAVWCVGPRGDQCRVWFPAGTSDESRRGSTCRWGCERDGGNARRSWGSSGGCDAGWCHARRGDAGRSDARECDGRDAWWIGTIGGTQCLGESGGDGRTEQCRGRQWRCSRSSRRTDRDPRWGSGSESFG